MRSLLFLLLLSLSACSSLTPPLTAPAATRVNAAFNLNGRLAVNNNGQRHSGGLRWQHQPQRDELLLQGPLGITVARIISDAKLATLEQNGKRYEAENVEALMRQVLGWGLPLPVVHHWLMGKVDDALPAQQERDALGRLTSLQQAGWQVHYQRYADDQADSLPTRITFSRDDLQVKLLIDEWDFEPR
jgi:outer membrane lipoprotein LolB